MPTIRAALDFVLAVTKASSPAARAETLKEREMT
jgi:hypothetical protein